MSPSKGTPHRPIRIKDELWIPAQEKAAKEGTSLSEVIRALLAQWVTHTHQNNERNDMPDLTRLTVNLNHETADALKGFAERQDISLTEAVRRAIALLKFIDDERNAGRKIQTMDSDGKNKRELVLM